MSPGSAPASISHARLAADPRPEPAATGIPLKRILEDDDIEFVSEKPVKKQRPDPDRCATAKPDAEDLAPRPATHPPVGRSRALEAAPAKAETGDADPSTRVEKGSGLGNAGPPPEAHAAPHPGPMQGAEPRGESLPGMESFTFPQSFPASSAAQQASPQISPKQAPQVVQPAPMRPVPMPVPTQQFFDPFLPFTDMLMQPTYPAMDAYGFMSALPPHMAMMPEAAFNQRPGPSHIPVASVVGDGGGHQDGRMLHPESNLMALAHVANFAAPAGTVPAAASHSHQSSHEPSPARTPESHAPPETPARPPTPAATPKPVTMPTNSESLPNVAASVQGSPVPSSPQHVPPPSHQQPPQMGQPAKKPCLICARARQQACLNNVHGMVPPGHPLVSQPYTHAIPGQAVPMQHAMPSSHPMRHLNSPLDINNLVGLPSSAMQAQGHMAAIQAGEGGPTPTRDASPSQMPQPPGRTTATSSPSSRSSAAPGKKPTVVTAAAGRLGNGSVGAAAAAPDGKRKPAPNIYVDIAETCLDMFPFAEVARRHAVSRQRVHDVFAAVIQLPLLRCPTDKRRVGKLGITRMKEYNKAKKDLTAEKQRVAAQKTAQKQAKSGAAGGQQRPQQQPAAPTQEPPNLYEVAQYMGPLDVPDEFRQGFPGPW